MTLQYDRIWLYEDHIAEAQFLGRCAASFARGAHGLAAAGNAAGAAMQRYRARVYRNKAHKRMHAARSAVLASARFAHGSTQ